MPKRRAGVNKIFYELDEHDSDSDSSDKAREIKPVAPARSKRTRGALRAAASALLNASIKRAKAADTDCVEVIDLETSGVIDVDSSTEDDGGKPASEPTAPEPEAPEQANSVEVQLESKEDMKVELEGSIDNNHVSFSKPSDPSRSDLTINVIDSVVLDSESNVVAGCENRSALITVRFRDKGFAHRYRDRIKDFLIKILKSDIESEVLSDTETDLELDIWAEDVSSKVECEQDGPNICTDMDIEKNEEDSSLFFVDTDPSAEHAGLNDVPQYCQSGEVLSDGKQLDSLPQRAIRQQTCFNCDGNHQLRECPLPRNYNRINQKRRAMVRVGRYHVEDDQRYGHLVAGRISGQLRHALGLKRDELPLHIYRMRLLGYPPGWLQEARISHSGITMFDSQGQAIQDPEDEDGELFTPGSKDKFDIKKILDYPGFNVAASSRYKENAHSYGLPPMSERDSKLLMLASLAPNAMQAYKRKKLTLFPSASNNTSLQAGSADMELGSDEDTGVEFPSRPPLPDDVPPPPPPPPEVPPPPPETPQLVPEIPLPKGTSSPPPVQPDADSSSQNNREKSQATSGRSSPSLTDLEEQQRMLLEALESGVSAPGSPQSPAIALDSSECSDKVRADSVVQEKQSTPEAASTPAATSTTAATSTPAAGDSASNILDKTPKLPSTPRSGEVKSSDYGTPVVNVASPFVKLPSDEKFAKDVCDIITFENLPNSIGTYKKMSALLKKVKEQVTKIQES